MTTVFFDFIHPNNKYLLDDLSNDTQNLIIFYLDTYEKIINLPSSLENIIIYGHRCGGYDIDENLNEDELDKYIFTKNPLNCKIHLLKKYDADKILWSKESYDDIKIASKDEVENKIKYINEEYTFFKNFDMDNYNVVGGWTKKEIENKINFFQTTILFEKYSKRHMLYELPDFIKVVNIKIYETGFNLTQHYDYQEHTSVDLRFYDVFIKNSENKRYLNFVIDEIQIINMGIHDYDYYFFNSLPNEFYN